MPENAPSVYCAPQATPLPKTPLLKQTTIEMLPQAPPAKTHKKAPLSKREPLKISTAPPPNTLEKAARQN